MWLISGIVEVTRRHLWSGIMLKVDFGGWKDEVLIDRISRFKIAFYETRRDLTNVYAVLLRLINIIIIEILSYHERICMYKRDSADRPRDHNWSQKIMLKVRKNMQ